MNYSPTRDFHKSGMVFNCTVNVIVLPHDNIPQKSPPPAKKKTKQPSSLNIVNLEETLFGGAQNTVPLYSYYGVGDVKNQLVNYSPFITLEATAIFSSPFIPFFLWEIETDRKALADRFVYLFEVPGIQPWVSQMQGKHSTIELHPQSPKWVVFSNSSILVFRSYKTDVQASKN